MSHIDLEALKSHFKNKNQDSKNIYKELSYKFESNKLITIFSTIIIGVASFTLAKVWDFSHDMTDIKLKLVSITEKLGFIESKIK